MLFVPPGTDLCNLLIQGAAPPPPRWKILPFCNLPSFFFLLAEHAVSGDEKAQTISLYPFIAAPPQRGGARNITYFEAMPLTVTLSNPTTVVLLRRSTTLTEGVPLTLTS